MHRSHAVRGWHRRGHFAVSMATGILVCTAVVAIAAAPAAAAAAAAPELTTDSGTAPILDGSDLSPGRTLENCVVLTYRNLPDGSHGLGMYGVPSGSGLADYLRLTVDVGSGGSFNDCSGFTGTTVFRDSLADFGRSHPAPASQLLLATVGAPDGAVTVRLRMRLVDDNRAQGASASAMFGWTVGEVGPAPAPSSPTPGPTSAPGPVDTATPGPAATPLPTQAPQPSGRGSESEANNSQAPSAGSPSTVTDSGRGENGGPDSTATAGGADPAASAGTVADADSQTAGAEVQGTVETNSPAPAETAAPIGEPADAVTAAGTDDLDDPTDQVLVGAAAGPATAGLLGAVPGGPPVGPPIAAVTAPLLPVTPELDDVRADESKDRGRAVGSRGTTGGGAQVRAQRLVGPAAQIRQAISQLVTTAQQAAPTAAKGGALGLGTLPFLLLFLLVQKRLDERDPKLALAPSYEDEYLTFDDVACGPVNGALA